ncbi:MAG: hypothetical protein ACRBBJ_08935 [Rhodomicrobiaceae bacterium]
MVKIGYLMPKFTISIDNDVDFVLFDAKVETLGHEASLQIKVKKMVNSPRCTELTSPDLIDLQEDQYEHVQPDQKAIDEAE